MVKNNLTKDLLMFTDELYEPDSQRSYSLSCEVYFYEPKSFKRGLPSHEHGF